MGQLALIVVALLALGACLVVSRYFALWLRGYVTRARISLPSLVFMSLRNINPRVIVDCRIMAVQAGVAEFSTADMEAHYLAGGNVPRVILALIVAHRAGIPLDWNTAVAIDLAGRNILEAVQLSVNPRVIDCPDPAGGGGATLDGVAKDGIQLQVRVRVTVRTNLAQLIGGATEATVIARVGQGIVAAIGACDTYHVVLADPVLITREVLSKGLDAQTAFAIVSIDIADVNVGDNIGARLQSEQAQADMRIAVARAEERRAMASAAEQEMRALTQQNRAAVVLSEAQVARGVAHAYQSGRLGLGTRTTSHRLNGAARYPRLGAASVAAR